jgi:hypothetical protein
MKGCGWNFEEKLLMESIAKKIYTEMPIVSSHTFNLIRFGLNHSKNRRRKKIVPRRRSI